MPRKPTVSWDVTVQCDADFDRLRWFNLTALLLHAALAITTLSIANLGLTLQVYDTKLNLTSERDGMYRLFPGAVVERGTLTVSVFVFLVDAVTALFHAGYTLFFHKAYRRAIRHCMNPARWVEYGVTASLQSIVIAYLSGVVTSEPLVAIAVLVSCTMLFGLVQEQYNRPRDALTWRIANPLTRVLPFMCGFVPFGAAVGLVARRFAETSTLEAVSPDGSVVQMPGFVYGIVACELALFACFPVIMLWQALSPPERFITFEYAYILCSLTSKAALAIILISNILYLDNNADLL